MCYVCLSPICTCCWLTGVVRAAEWMCIHVYCDAQGLADAPLPQWPKPGLESQEDSSPRKAGTSVKSFWYEPGFPHAALTVACSKLLVIKLSSISRRGWRRRCHQTFTICQIWLRMTWNGWAAPLPLSLPQSWHGQSSDYAPLHPSTGIRWNCVWPLHI